MKPLTIATILYFSAFAFFAVAAFLKSGASAGVTLIGIGLGIYAVAMFARIFGLYLEGK